MTSHFVLTHFNRNLFLPLNVNVVFNSKTNSYESMFVGMKVNLIFFLTDTTVAIVPHSHSTFHRLGRKYACVCVLWLSLWLW